MASISQNHKDVILNGIIYQKEPDEAVESMRIGLKQMVAGRAFNTPLLCRAVTEKAAEPVLGQALQVYHLGLSDLAEGKDIRAAVHAGWYTVVS